MRRLIVLGGILAFLAAGCWAQAASPGSGHWEGALQTPNGEMAMIVDLGKNPAGLWIGSMSLPTGNVNDVPLSKIFVDSGAVRFSMADIPGAPSFEGKLSADTNELSGTAASPNGMVPFQLKRKGDANVKLPPASSALSKDFEGNWEGAIEAGGNRLRIVLKLSRAADGSATGTMVSVDQGNQEFPVSAITISDRQLKLDVRAVGGTYNGTLGANGEIDGTWTQGPGTLPLHFKRP
jgi:hypothetical protein